jgi:hypothetical protein
MYHPYELLYPEKNIPYLGEKYNLDIEKIPIFSQSITNEYSDVLIPNDDDILNILGNKFDSNLCYDWNSKKNIAVFRGSATGCGVTPEDNPRLKVIEIGEENQSLIDAKLIGLNRKLKINNKRIATMIDKNKYPQMNKEYKEKYYLNSYAQSEYKYIIHIQGHVAAFRLTKELSYKSLILKVDSDYKTWYSDKLIGFDPFSDLTNVAFVSHYIIVKKNLSNLVKVIKWCIANDNLCKTIAENGYNFWEKYLKTNDYMFNYMQNKLKKYSIKQNKL